MKVSIKSSYFRVKARFKFVSYGMLIWYDKNDTYHEEKVVSVDGNYAQFYEAIYESLVNGAEPLVKEWQTIELMHQLEAACESLEQQFD
ncbi:hypothetical protein [Dubosiella newyorkensis]|uniref:hypothetical protein n=1 Tax=Dubosiella newyorkensis TaxID=1862672 RepID=UPI000AF20291|nr:hypothetical protein [Dubosiella newyorkensis]